MAALVAPGAPVSVLIEYGLAEKLVERLLETGVGTIEKLGGMTPEQLEEFGIGPEMVEQIQDAVNAYYSQFEDSPATETPESVPAEEPLAAAETQLQDATEAPAEQAGSLEAEANPIEESDGELSADAGTQDTAEQFGTIEDAGSPSHNQPERTDPEGAGPEDTEHGAGSPERGR
jgi:N utilization substance protein A